MTSEIRRVEELQLPLWDYGWLAAERFDDPEFYPPSADQIASADALLDRLESCALATFRLRWSLSDASVCHELAFIHTVFDEYAVTEGGRSLWLLVVGYD